MLIFRTFFFIIEGVKMYAKTDLEQKSNHNNKLLLSPNINNLHFIR